MRRLLAPLLFVLLLLGALTASADVLPDPYYPPPPRPPRSRAEITAHVDPENLATAGLVLVILGIGVAWDRQDRRSTTE